MKLFCNLLCYHKIPHQTYDKTTLQRSHEVPYDTETYVTSTKYSCIAFLSLPQHVEQGT